MAGFQQKITRHIKMQDMALGFQRDEVIIRTRYRYDRQVEIH